MYLEMVSSGKNGQLPDFARAHQTARQSKHAMEPTALLYVRLFSTSYLNHFFRSIIKLAFFDPSAKRRRQHRRHEGDSGRSDRGGPECATVELACTAAEYLRRLGHNPGTQMREVHRGLRRGAL